MHEEQFDLYSGQLQRNNQQESSSGETQACKEKQQSSALHPHRHNDKFFTFFFPFFPHPIFTILLFSFLSVISPFSNQVLLEMVLFNFLKCDDGLFMFEENDMFFIEVMNCLDIILKKRMSCIELFPTVTIGLNDFSTDIISLNSSGAPQKSKNFKLLQTVGILKRLRANSLDGEENFDLWKISAEDERLSKLSIDDVNISEDARLPKWSILDEANISGEECLASIFEFAPVLQKENPSFGTIMNFVRIFDKAMVGFRAFYHHWVVALEQCVDDLKVLHKSPSCIVRILVDTANVLARRNLRKNINAQQQMNPIDSIDEAKLINYFVDQYSCRYGNFVKWENMSHLMANFLGFGINIFGMSEEELKRRLPDVFDFFSTQKCLNSFPADSKMTKDKLMMAKNQIEKALAELDPFFMFEAGTCPELDLEGVALTEDTFFKASAILHRFFYFLFLFFSFGFTQKIQ